MSNPRLSIIPAGAVTDRSLEPRDLQTLCLLGRHTDRGGWCTRSQVRMAAELGCGRASVQRSLDRLYDAGWVEKKRRDGASEDSDSRPSMAHAYRVRLDRDDDAFDSAVRDADGEADDSHAETATDEQVASDGGCPPVGTPPCSPMDGHPGAQPCVGTRAHTYVGTKNDPLERPPIERERDARARDRKARFLADFEKRWPTAAVDHRQRTAYAADALTEAEEEAALAGIGPFLDDLKRQHRKNVPAGWRYLEEKRWTLLEAKASSPAAQSSTFARDSAETRAILVLYDIAGKRDWVYQTMLRGERLYWRGTMTPKLQALASAPPRAEWPVLDRQQAAAWEQLLGENVAVHARSRLSEGSRAPWPWPPRKDGTIAAEAAQGAEVS